MGQPHALSKAHNYPGKKCLTQETARPTVSPMSAMDATDESHVGTILAPPSTLLASNPSFICVTAKAPHASTQFVLPELSTIQQFKEKLSRHFHCEPHQVVLVFFGRILKDQDTLQQCGVGDGMTIHLVIRSPKRKQEESLPQPPFTLRTPACPPVPLDPLRTLSPSCTKWQLVPTSETLFQKVLQVILANPEVQQLVRQVPAIRHILNNMGIMRVILDKMREILELAKNPEPTPDFLKGSDPALTSTQSNIPGGDNPLRQLNSEGQEPTVAQDLFAQPSPYATLMSNPCLEHPGLSSPGPPVDSQEGIGPLPISTKLWTNSCNDDPSPFHSLASPLKQSSSMPSFVPGPTSGLFSAQAAETTTPTTTAAEIPQLIVNLCNAYTKRLMFSLMQNALLDSEGELAGHPEQVQRQLCHFSEQMQSPEMVAAMSNPRAIQAWVQMEQGLQTLVAEAPVLLPWFMLRLRGLRGHSMAGGSPWSSDPPGPASTVIE